jgi:predicted  nucleic acid-binding Zn-ribbon protein
MNGVQLGALLTVGLPFLAVYATGVALFNGVSAAKASIKEARENSLPHLQDKKLKLEDRIKTNTEALKQTENSLKAINTQLEARNLAEKDVKPADYHDFVVETGKLERKQLSENIHLLNLIEKQGGLEAELSKVNEKLKPSTS